jgi:hypothetical protein
MLFLTIVKIVLCVIALGALVSGVLILQPVLPLWLKAVVVLGPLLSGVLMTLWWPVNGKR